MRSARRDPAADRQIGSTHNGGLAVVAVTRTADIGTIRCPQTGRCVALGVSDQGSTPTPVYTDDLLNFADPGHGR
jgi:hypothetical protein